MDMYILTHATKGDKGIEIVTQLVFTSFGEAEKATLEIIDDVRKASNTSNLQFENFTRKKDNLEYKNSQMLSNGEESFEYVLLTGEQ